MNCTDIIRITYLLPRWWEVLSLIPWLGIMSVGLCH